MPNETQTIRPNAGGTLTPDPIVGGDGYVNRDGERRFQFKRRYLRRYWTLERGL